jgi:hypothetical protein
MAPLIQTNKNPKRSNIFRLKIYQQSMATLERNLDEERDRQNNVLKEKVRRNDEEYF